MLPSTWLVAQSRTLRARMLPCTRPRTVTSSAQSSPCTKALSPTTSPVLRTSPSTRPSTWMSPVETSVPFTTRSALIMDGAEARVARLTEAGAGAAGGVVAAAVSFLLENMSAGLDEGARVSHDIVIPNLIMHMRSRAAPSRSKLSDRSACRDIRPYLHQDRREMAIARVDAEAVINLHHVAIAAALAGIDHASWRRRLDQRAPWSGEIDPGVKRILPGERIDASAKSARSLEL